jgi:prepilin-type processing-associated H-X9-DG protein
LTTPKLLACPADEQRQPGTNFDGFSNFNLSYLVGLPPIGAPPGAILAADRNFPACRHSPPGPTIGYFTNVPPPRWVPGLHGRKGNVLLADGHVEKSHDDMVLSEYTVLEFVVFPDVNASAAYSSSGGATPGGPMNPVGKTGITSTPVDRVSSSPVVGNQTSPNPPHPTVVADLTQGNSSSLNRPVSARSDASNIRSVSTRFL